MKHITLSVADRNGLIFTCVFGALFLTLLAYCKRLPPEPTYTRTELVHALHEAYTAGYVDGGYVQAHLDADGVSHAADMWQRQKRIDSLCFSYHVDSFVAHPGSRH